MMARPLFMLLFSYAGSFHLLANGWAAQQTPFHHPALLAYTILTLQSKPGPARRILAKLRVKFTLAVRNSGIGRRQKRKGGLQRDLERRFGRISGHPRTLCIQTWA
jgi:hypothetical protein